jgi:hypothetical protein
MSTNEDVTLGELVRRIDGLVKQLEDLVRSLGDDYVRQDVFDEYKRSTVEIHSQNIERIAKLESWQEWLIRAVIGFVIAAVLSAVFVFANKGGA